MPCRAVRTGSGSGQAERLADCAGACPLVSHLAGYASTRRAATTATPCASSTWSASPRTTRPSLSRRPTCTASSSPGEPSSLPSPSPRPLHMLPLPAHTDSLLCVDLASACWSRSSFSTTHSIRTPTSQGCVAAAAPQGRVHRLNHQLCWARGDKQVGGLKVQELNNLEQDFLSYLRFELGAHPDAVQAYWRRLQPFTLCTPECGRGT